MLSVAVVLWFVHAVEARIVQQRILLLLSTTTVNTTMLSVAAAVVLLVIPLCVQAVGSPGIRTDSYPSNTCSLPLPTTIQRYYYSTTTTTTTMLSAASVLV